MKKPTVQNIMDVLNMPACERPRPAAVAPPSAPKLCVKCGEPKTGRVHDTLAVGSGNHAFAFAPPETTAPTATWMTAVLQSRALTDDELDTAARKLVETLHGERRDDVAAGCVAELRSRWWSLVSPHRQPVASSATPEVTFTPVRVPHLPQIESSVASSATPTPATETPTQFSVRMMAKLGQTFPSVVLASTLPAAIGFAAQDYAASQQEVERLRHALQTIKAAWWHEPTLVQSCDAALTTEPR